MHSSLIGKIEKARRYAQESDRVSFTSFKTKFRGEHDYYEVEYDGGRWHCTCNFFGGWGVCSHTMALQRILGEMLPKETQPAVESPSTLAPSA
jgi:hypothetical protein